MYIDVEVPVDVICKLAWNSQSGQTLYSTLCSYFLIVRIKVRKNGPIISVTTTPRSCPLIPFALSISE